MISKVPFLVFLKWVFISFRWVPFSKFPSSPNFCALSFWGCLLLWFRWCLFFLSFLTGFLFFFRWAPFKFPVVRTSSTIFGLFFHLHWTFTPLHPLIFFSFLFVSFVSFSFVLSLLYEKWVCVKAFFWGSFICFLLSIFFFLFYSSIYNIYIIL